MNLKKEGEKDDKRQTKNQIKSRTPKEIFLEDHVTHMKSHVSHAMKMEDMYVHEVYEKIAVHFSRTRQKPWPIVEKYLLKQPIGSLGVDIGCGNGRYLSINPNLFLIGIDR